MEKDNRFAVIMAGGRGERFWPLSTAARPKQVLSLVGGRPMLAQAVERLKGFIPPERILIITSAALVDVSREAVPELPPANVIGEPCGRDTAAACALGAAVVKARCAGGTFCILTADHVIKRIDRFLQILEHGFRVAERGDALVTIGIKPVFPSTGFGYIDCGEVLDDGDVRVYKARRFVEKPDAQTADAYLQSGHYLWNSGMFIWKADTLLAALAQYEKPVHAMACAMLPVVDTPAFAASLTAEYNRLGRISIDYAVMEKAPNIVTASGDFEWYDVGSWPALEDHFEKDADGNVIIGEGAMLDSSGNVVVSGNRLTALIGVNDLVVVHAEKATLICPKSRAQDVKQMVQQLAGNARYADVI
jgi:mannose-1-phosphate guanylyltransferase